MNNSKIIGKTGFLIAVLLMVFGFILASCGMSDKKIDETLVKIAAEANKDLPMMLDSQTRLDSIEALPGKKIQYSNTIVEALAEDFDLEFFNESVGRSLLASVKNNVSLETFRKRQVTFIYKYQDKTGAEIAVFEYAPEDYK